MTFYHTWMIDEAAAKSGAPATVGGGRSYGCRRATPNSQPHCAIWDALFRRAACATLRLGTRRVVHSSAQAEFELADATVHAEQKASVWAAWIIDPVEIDGARANETAEFRQMVPVAAVAGKPPCVEARHGAGIAGATPRDQPIEAWPGHGSARRAPEIVVRLARRATAL